MLFYLNKCPQIKLLPTAVCLVISLINDSSRLQATSRSFNIPYEVLDADLFTRLFVKLVPFTLSKRDIRERSARVSALGLPDTLLIVKIHKLRSKGARQRRYTSGMNSVNSRPRVSNSMMFCCVGGDWTMYGFGAVLMEAVDSRFRR